MELLVVSVQDAFEIKPNRPGSNHAPGLVVIFDGRQCGFHLPPLGSAIDLIRPDGSSGRATVQEIKEHGDGRSFFFPSMHRDDAPVGTVLYWSPPAVASSLTGQGATVGGK